MTRYGNYDELSKPSRIISAVTPGNVDIKPEKSRIGHETRARAIKHLREMSDQGYITCGEADKRIRHAVNATQRAEINVLISDLPGYTDRRTWFQKWDWDDSTCYVPVLIAGMAISLCTAIVPATVMSADKMFPHQGTALAIGILTIIIGVLGFVGSLGGLLVKD